MKAIRFEKTGGPDVLEYKDVDLAPPGRGQARVRHSAIGVNFIDTYHRSGLYPVALGPPRAATVHVKLSFAVAYRIYSDPPATHFYPLLAPLTCAELTEVARWNGYPYPPGLPERRAERHAAVARFLERNTAAVPDS